jgi:hypothetical protein
MAMVNIAIADGKAAPVTHTFVPMTAQTGNTPAVWFNKLTGFSSRAWEAIRTLVTLADSPKKEHRLNLTVELPKVVLVDGSEVYQGSIRGYATVIMPSALNTDDNAKDIFALLKNALAHAEADRVFKTQSPST